MDADTERDIVERLREDFPEQFKDEQPAQVIFEYEWERHEAAYEITRLRAQPSPREAIELIEKRRENYIRENCKSIGIGGDWEGTVAQEEYIAELDDIIEMLRTADTKGK